MGKLAELPNGSQLNQVSNHHGHPVDWKRREVMMIEMKEGTKGETQSETDGREGKSNICRESTLHSDLPSQICLSLPEVSIE